MYLFIPSLCHCCPGKISGLVAAVKFSEMVASRCLDRTCRRGVGRIPTQIPLRGLGLALLMYVAPVKYTSENEPLVILVHMYG